MGAVISVGDVTFGLLRMFRPLAYRRHDRARIISRLLLEFSKSHRSAINAGAGCPFLIANPKGSARKRCASELEGASPARPPVAVHHQYVFFRLEMCLWLAQHRARKNPGHLGFTTNLIAFKQQIDYRLLKKL